MHFLFVFLLENMVFWLWYVPSMCYEFILYTMVPDIFYLFSGVINSYFSSHGSHVSLCSDTACIWHWDMWWTLLLFYFAIWNRTHNIWSNNAADQTHFKTQNTISAHLIQSLPISTMFRFYTFNSLMLVFTTVDRSLTSHPHQLNLWLLPIIQYDCSLYRCLFFCSLYKIYSIFKMTDENSDAATSEKITILLCCIGEMCTTLKMH